MSFWFSYIYNLISQYIEWIKILLYFSIRYVVREFTPRFLEWMTFTDKCFYKFKSTTIYRIFVYILKTLASLSSLFSTNSTFPRSLDKYRVVQKYEWLHTNLYKYWAVFGGNLLNNPIKNSNFFYSVSARLIWKGDHEVVITFLLMNCRGHVWTAVVESLWTEASTSWWHSPKFKHRDSSGWWKKQSQHSNNRVRRSNRQSRHQVNRLSQIGTETYRAVFI